MFLTFFCFQNKSPVSYNEHLKAFDTSVAYTHCDMKKNLNGKLSLDFSFC